MTELLIVADAEGNIKAATTLNPPGNARPGATLEVRVEPGDGEKTYTVALPDDLRAAGSLKGLDNYVLEVQRDEATLRARK
ncbi:hypothetical protein ACIBCO_33495 [Streptomyces violascens]|uniref:hypothetical protein n=1 Tax=Streptomyces violascens TaxID=67381 RepID=UPI00379FCCD4